MTNPIAIARRDYDNADEAFRLNPTDANLASYEVTRKALLAAEAGLSSNAAVDDEEDQDERPFPDSDEAIRALQDVAEAVEELEAEIARLRAENKLLRAERDEARQLACEFWVMDGSGYSSSKRARESAIERGWDCFTNDSNA